MASIITPTNIETANKLKEQGNEKVKSQKYSDAIPLYQEAIKLDETNPVYYSNISLCFYEIGDYTHSLEFSKIAIEYSERENSYNLNILIKNLIRQAHILFYQNEFDKVRESIEKLNQIFSKCNLEIEPYLSFSKEINELKVALENCQNLGNLSQEKFLPNNIPKFRSATDTVANELYAIGHDNAMTALRCHAEEDPENSENSTTTDFKKYNIHILDLLEKENKVDLSFLYGGVGDCRHVYVTLIDIFYQLKEAENKHNNSPKKLNLNNVKISLGLNDIHPNSLAKIIICLFSFKFLYESSYEDLTKETKSAEICEMLHFVFFGAIMPEYINQRLMDILAILSKFELKDLLTELPYIIIDEQTWLTLRNVISRWLNEKCPCSNNAIMNRYTVNSNENDVIDFSQMNNEMCQNLDKIKEEKKKKDLEQTKIILDQMSDDKIDEMLKLKKIDTSKFPQDVSKKDLLFNLFKEILTDDKFQKIRNLDLIECIKDNTLVSKHKILFPPNKNYLEVFNLEKNIKVEKLPKDKVQAAIKSWKLNVTMLDFDWIIKYGYAELSFNPVETVGQIYKNKIIKSPTEPKKLYHYTSNYFLTIAQSLKYLSNNVPKIKLEILLGDIHSICEDITLSYEERIKNELPKYYDRIFMSNIPDYTGMLGHFLYVFPLLKKNEFSYINSNILLATGLYKDYTEYIHTSTLMKNDEDYRKIFSAKLIDGDVWGENKWGYNIGLDEKLNKEEFQLWLVKVFLHITMPTRRDERTQIRENYCSTMNIFFKLCHYMITVRKYPLHWIAQVLENICRNSLFTKARFPYHSPNPVGFYDKNKVEKINLDTFLLEFRTLLEIWLPLLGFNISLGNQVFANDIAKYTLDLNIESEFLRFTGFAKSGILSLAIEAKSKSFDLHDDLRVRFLCYKSKDSYESELNLLTMLEFDSAKGIVWFWLSKSEFEKLSEKDYQVYLLRTDSWKCIHEKVPLKNAILIQ
jgi:tetratricopeptide (TPR) repeat protein